MQTFRFRYTEKNESYSNESSRINPLGGHFIHILLQRRNSNLKLDGSIYFPLMNSTNFYWTLIFIYMWVIALNIRYVPNMAGIWYTESNLLLSDAACHIPTLSSHCAEAAAISEVTQ